MRFHFLYQGFEHAESFALIIVIFRIGSMRMLQRVGKEYFPVNHVSWENHFYNHNKKENVKKTDLLV